MVADAAGNETVGTRRVDGAPATLRLPLRRPTALAVRRSGRLLRARLTAGGAALAGRAADADPAAARPRRAGGPCAARRTVIVAAAAALRAADRPRRAASRSASRPGRRGRSASPSPGTRCCSPPAAARPSAPRRAPGCARARRPSAPGGTVVFSGRLLGGHVPRAGKLVELQALVGPGWRTFATVRTDRRGRLRHTHRFAATSAGPHVPRPPPRPARGRVSVRGGRQPPGGRSGSDERRADHPGAATLRRCRAGDSKRPRS